MIRSFKAKNFRNINIDKNALEFKRVNLFIGPNNSGKSNLVNAITMLPDMMVNGSDGQAFLSAVNRRGWDEILRRDSQDESIMMSWELDIDEKSPTIYYFCQFNLERGNPFPKGVYFTEEFLELITSNQEQEIPFRSFISQFNMLGRGSFPIHYEVATDTQDSIEIPVDATETVLRQTRSLLDSDIYREKVFPLINGTLKSLRSYSERFRAHSSTNFSMARIREANKIDIYEKFLEPDGSNFVNVLGNLEDQHDFLDLFQRRLNTLIPDLKRIKIVLASDEKRQVQLDIGGKKFKLSEMSDGTLQAMLLTLLLWSPEKLKVLMLDEPEVNLHPAWLKIIGNWMLETKSTDQLFISTHSPDLLDVFTKAFQQNEVALFVCNLNQENTVEAVAPEKLAPFFEKGYELGDLYRVGEPRLGGWPF